MTTLEDLTVPRVDQSGPASDAPEFIYVDIGSIDNARKRIAEPKQLPVGDAPSRARQRLVTGDVLVSMTRPNLNAVAIVPPDLDGAVGSTGFHVLRVREGVVPEWLYYGVQSRRFIEAMTAVVQGALYPAVRSKDIRAFALPTPSVDEQRKIVAEIEKQFSRLDEAIAGLQRTRRSLQKFRNSALLHAFANEAADWAWATYSDVGEVTTGFTPPTSEATNFGGDVAFFKPTDLDQGDNVRVAREYLTVEGLSKGRKLRAGSVLVTCIGATIGKTGLAQVDCATNQQINAVTPRDGLVDPRFLYWWTVSPMGRRQILDNASATTLPIINKSKFSALRVPLPPIAEQAAIVAEVDRRLSIVRGVEAEVDANLKRAQALRQAILAKAFAQPEDAHAPA